MVQKKDHHIKLTDKLNFDILKLKKKQLLNFLNLILD